MLEGEHGKHPYAAADALHTDSLALQIRRRLDTRVDHERAVKFVDQPRDVREIESARHRTDRRPGCRTNMKLSFAGRQSRHAALSIAHIDEGRIDTILLKNSRIARHPQNGAALVQAAEGVDHFVRRRTK